MSPLAIYFHLPYCIKKCPYCDFNSYAIDSQAGELGTKEDTYIRALISELSYYAKTLPRENQAVSSIFFGGGTPSLFSSLSISRLIDHVSQHFGLFDDCEVTLEANPGSIFEPLNIEKLKEYRAGGVNRLSLGCQSFSDKKLQFLGRVHSAEHTHRAIENFRAAGFENFNLDLIFACKDETVEEWKNDLDTALSFEPQHISAYGLTIEPGTDFGRLSKQGKQLNCSEEDFAEMYSLCAERLGNAGFSRYEISNYARQGKQCVHNLAYWSRQSYLGLGAGAHSFLASGAVPHSTNAGWGVRWINEVKPERYIQKCDESSHAKQRHETLNKTEALTEYIFTSLRKNTGLDIGSLTQQFGNIDFTEPCSALLDEGLIQVLDGRIALNARGFLYSDYVFEQFTRSFPAA